MEMILFTKVALNLTRLSQEGYAFRSAISGILKRIIYDFNHLAGLLGKSD